MPACVVRTEMIRHGGVGMLDRHFLIIWIAAELCGIEKKIQIHHVVDDDREVPFSEIP